MQVTNVIGSVQSPALQFVLAGVPAKPAPAPTVDASGTTVAAITVNFANGNADTGGSPVLLYELQMDDGLSGEFSTVFTSYQQTFYTANETIVRGRYYRFRYRVHNVVGASEWSDAAYIQATEAPTKPEAPNFVNATDTTLTVSLIESTDSRGRDVQAYELWIDQGDDLTSTFRNLSSYDGQSTTYTLTVAADGLGAAGTLYRIKSRAKNIDGVYSEWSEFLVVALGAVPAAVSTPYKDDAASGAGQIAVKWAALTGQTLPIYGYKLYCDMASDHNFTVVFDGTNQPEARQYLLENIADPQQTYKFYATAISFNGEGAPSSTARLKACTLPSTGLPGFPAPIVESVTSANITISWTPPADDGGCEISSYAVYVDNADDVYAEYDSTNVRSKPFLSSYTIDMATLGKAVGSTYRIRLGAVNRIGEVSSDVVTVLLASVPAAPAAPVKQLLNSTHAQIIMSPPSSDGGNMVTSYEL